MQTKKCSKCGEIKQICDFNRNEKCKFGVRSECRECQKTNRNLYRSNNKSKVQSSNKKYYENNKETFLLTNRKYLKNLKETNPCKYYADATWRTLNQRCVNGKYANAPSIQKSYQMQSYHKKQILIQITQDELKQFWKDNESLVKSILASGGTPTIDRIDDNRHYTLSNMQILDRKANIHKSRGYADKPACVDKETQRKENARRYRESQKKEN